eukprot:TRINITY_DN59738_c0_g1_i1.p1 TRINITY_DN59738_c0_g1~~TRINITY_DN59738_c0_g1_i1.p1  ORF type:complete len:493 (-),score=131.77 TRINITY_DN59738_c0_g1_i1:283-1761(-)
MLRSLVGSEMCIRDSFYALLPPIIFNAGFTMRRKNFFINMGTILAFAVLGTTISTTVIALGSYAYSHLDSSALDASDPLECLLFATLISAIDPVATLATFEHVGANPMLYNLVFGESVLNDAVCVVMFQALMSVGSSVVWSAGPFWHTLGSFCEIMLGSLGCGVLIGLGSAFVLLRTDNLRFEQYELPFLLLSAYSAYLLAECLGMSGITAIFFCGIIMAHYSYHNVCRESQVSALRISSTLAFLCENFVFVYLGLSLFTFQLEWRPGFIAVALVLCLLGRALHVFTLSWAANRFRPTNRQITPAMQVMLWFAGLRGAIAFALALNMSSTPNKNVVVTTTLFIVLVSTLVLGAAVEPLLHSFQLTQRDVEVVVLGEGLELSEQGEVESPHQEVDSHFNPRMAASVLETPPVPPRPGGMRSRWNNFDQRFMRGLFGGSGASLASQYDIVDPEGQFQAEEEKEENLASSAAGDREDIDVGRAVAVITGDGRSFL